MENNIEKNQSEVENVRTFQFIKTNRIGEKIQLKNIITDQESGDILLVFDDGTRLNESVVGISLEELPPGHPGYEFNKEVINDLREEKDSHGNIQLIPGPDHGKIKWHKRALQSDRVNKTQKKKNASSNPNILSSQHANNIIIQQTPPKTDSPIDGLLERAKKTLKSYKIDININSIDKNLYNVIADNYENGADKIAEHLINSIDFDKLKSELAVKIKQTYESKGKQRGKAEPTAVQE